MSTEHCAQLMIDTNPLLKLVTLTGKGDERGTTKVVGHFWVMKQDFLSPPGLPGLRKLPFDI